MAVDRLPAPLSLAGITAGALAAGFALLVGVGIGNEDRGLVTVASLLVVAAVLLAACLKPRFSLLVLVTTTITLPFVPITETRGTNLVDLLIIPTFIGAMLGVRRARLAALPADLAKARSRFTWSYVFYVAAAVLSLIVLLFRGYPAEAGDSALLLFRFVEGSLFFVLIERLVRTRDDLMRVRDAIVIGFLVGVVVNIYGLAFQHAPRAGAAWNVLIGEYFISSPNEAGFGVTYLWALLLAMPMRRGRQVAVLLLSVPFLVATASRSGIVSWVAFLVVWAIQARKAKWLLIPLALAAIVPFLPEAVTGRFTRTLFLKRGSFEVYSTLVRVYAWHTAVHMFLAFPIFGVGYLSFRHFSHQFNSLTLNLGTAENFLLEAASGTGIVGLAAALWCGASIVRLARAIVRLADPRSEAHRLARLSTPFFAANFLANMTGDNLFGIMAVSQLAVFCGLMVAAARLEAIDLRLPAAPPATST